jgi:serine/threonine protein kinase
VSIHTQDEIGTDFVGYRIEALIGRGGMGVVYRAYDLRLKRVVALKLVAPELALDERFRGRFARESELAMSLEHPNVVPIYDAGDVDGRLYLAMRNVEGTDLGALLRGEAKLEPARALAIAGQVGNALDAAHARGLVHRDVKPSNVLLDQDEHVYLADLGLTQRLEEHGQRAGENRSVGTPAYLAPEQIEGRPVDGRADVYSLGCLLYECLTGESPFAADSRLAVAWAHLEEEPPSASERNPDLPEAIDAVIRKGMAKAPEERYPTCAALIAAAEAALGLRQRRSSAEGGCCSSLLPRSSLLSLRQSRLLFSFEALAMRTCPRPPSGRTPSPASIRCETRSAT